MRKFLYSIGEKIYQPSYFIEPGIPQANLYCHLPKNIETAFQDCLSLGEDAKKRRILLVGDSHASNHHWSIKNALEQINTDYTFNTLIEYGFIKYLAGNDRCESTSICIENAGSIYKDFFGKNLKKGDFLFISIARDRFTIGNFKGSARKQNHKRLKSLKKRLLDLSQIAEENGAKIVLIGDIPKVCPDNINYLHEVIRRGNINLCKISKKISKQDRFGMNNTFIDITKKSKNAIYVDPHDELCENKVCYPINTEGLVLYSDVSPHFTENSKEILTSFWSKTFIELGIADKSL